MPKLTKRVVEGTEPGYTDTILRDSELKGFICKITPRGRRVYMLYYRTREGRERKPAIGVHGAITCEQARETAREWLAIVAKGGDPSQDKTKARESETVEQLCDRYLTHYAEKQKKPSSVAGDKFNIKKHIKPALGKLRVGSATRKDIIDFHHGLHESPIMANRCLALLSKMFSLAEKWEMRREGTNPCRGVERYPERRRERFLSVEEIGNLSAALAQAEQHQTEPQAAIDAIRLLLLTGCRRDEILTLQWDHVNFDNHCLRLPDSKTGAKTIYLNAPALQLLGRVTQQKDNPYVIVGRKEKTRLVGLRRVWVRMCEKAGIKEARLHDLRHSHASIAAASGLSLPMIGALLGHTQPSTTQRYAHLIGDPMLEATNIIGQRLKSAMKPKKKKKQAQVVAFPQRRTK